MADLENKKRKIKRIIIAIVILIIFVFLFGNRNFRKLLVMSDEIKKLEQNIEKLKKENALLKQEMDEIKTNPEYFEYLARKKLGLIKPGELKYKLISPQKGKETKK